MSWGYLGDILDTSLGYFGEIFGKSCWCLGDNWGIFLGYILRIFLGYFEDIWGIFWGYLISCQTLVWTTKNMDRQGDSRKRIAKPLPHWLAAAQFHCSGSPHSL